MSKKIQDYLPYYIGQEVEFGYEGRKAVGELLGHDVRFGYQVFDPRSAVVPYKFCRIDLITLRLRPLSDMTDKELSECGNMLYDFSDDPDPEMRTHKWEYFRDMIASEQFHYLLKQGFDLFGLIEAGLAVDKTKEVK